MIAKIGRGSNLYGTLEYNLLKVQKDEASVVFTSKIIETVNGQYSAAQLARSFQTLLASNRNTEKPVIHISLNPDPKDIVDDDRFREMAAEYMEKMGYGRQPFVVFKHTDLERTHIHIVSVCVDEDGRKISDKFEKRRSMNLCREMEKNFELIPATEKELRQTPIFFYPVDHLKGDIKSQIASVVRHLPKYYKFQTLGEYNALLSLFNITTVKVQGELNGTKRNGLVYIALTENGDKVGYPLKASLFGKNAGLAGLYLHFAKSKKSLKGGAGKANLIATINKAVQSTPSEKDFKIYLAGQGINVVVRSNDKGRIYGMTFIDHNSKAVWNGSGLGPLFSANTFNEYWRNAEMRCKNEDSDQDLSAKQQNTLQSTAIDSPHELFGFLDLHPNYINPRDNGIVDALGGLLPEAHEFDWEELKFVSQLKKKRRQAK